MHIEVQVNTKYVLIGFDLIRSFIFQKKR